MKVTMRTLASSSQSAGSLLALAAAAITILPGALATQSGGAAVVAQNASVGPVQKVIEMLEAMVDKAKKNKHQEAVDWAAYKQYCSDVETARQSDVKEMNLRLEEVSAAIEKHKMDIGDLGSAIDDHNQTIQDMTNSTFNATEVRKGEREAYEAMHKDLSESITACQQAIEVLSAENYKRRGQAAAALLQKVASQPRTPQKASRVLQLYLAQTGEEPDPLSVTAPVANAYEFQSHSILDMLKELKIKFSDERHELEKEEMRRRHAYEMMSLDYRNALAVAKQHLQKKEKIRGDVEVALAEARAEVTEVTDSRDADLTFLKDLRGTCQQKSSDFEERQKLRGEEIEALTGALTILKGPEVGEAAAEHLRSMLQQVPKGRKGTSLVQAGGGVSARGAAAERQTKALAYLQERSGKLGSRVLAALVEQAQDDPFAKVRKMIQDLINKLLAAADEEEDHKNWCDGELGTNKQTRDTKTGEVENLRETVDTLTNDIAILNKDIAQLTEEVAELLKAMATEQELRNKEQAQNQDTIAEAVEAQSAVSQAIAILKDFYDKAGDATALAQRGAAARGGQAPPNTFNAPYKGVPASERNNVFAFLEVIQSDFARLESETSDAENAAQQAFDDYMGGATSDRDQKNGDIKNKKDAVISKKEELDTAINDLDKTQGELDAALTYYEKLKPSCIGTQETGTSDFNTRIQRRQEEIASLKQALTILNGEDIPGPAGRPAESLYSGVDGGNVGYDVGIVAGQQ